MCGCRNLGEALRRIAEGASMIRTKGEAGPNDGKPGREVTCATCFEGLKYGEMIKHV